MNQNEKNAVDGDGRAATRKRQAPNTDMAWGLAVAAQNNLRTKAADAWAKSMPDKPLKPSRQTRLAKAVLPWTRRAGSAGEYGLLFLLPGVGSRAETAPSLRDAAMSGRSLR